MVAQRLPQQNDEDAIKREFEARWYVVGWLSHSCSSFLSLHSPHHADYQHPHTPTRPGITLDLTTDLSKYHAVRFDQQLAAGKVTVDSIAFQTVDRFPGWDAEGALLHYAPNGFDMIYPPMRDVRAAFYGILTVGWSGKWNMDKVGRDRNDPLLSSNMCI